MYMYLTLATLGERAVIDHCGCVALFWIDNSGMWDNERDSSKADLSPALSVCIHPHSNNARLAILASHALVAKLFVLVVHLAMASPLVPTFDTLTAMASAAAAEAAATIQERGALGERAGPGLPEPARGWYGEADAMRTSMPGALIKSAAPLTARTTTSCPSRARSSATRMASRSGLASGLQRITRCGTRRGFKSTAAMR